MCTPYVPMDFRVPHYNPDIPKSQDLYNIHHDNSTKPFVHKLLQDNYGEYVHPLQLKGQTGRSFRDKDEVLDNLQPMLPNSLSNTPFTLIETIDELEVLAKKLENVKEFAVDLEGHTIRSYLGLTCLMQISTRDEDFVVDTLKLFHHIGPCLGKLFQTSSKKKVMHGASNDILWLQRDFGIYVCNLFDTHEASRVLETTDGHSLESLLQYYCNVQTDKSMQLEDWRERPLPDDMLTYARMDTHYLLYIFDRMRLELVSLSPSKAALVKVYSKSNNVCTRLYKKPLPQLDQPQNEVATKLYSWRDALARKEDESTGYVMPNRVLSEIASRKFSSSQEVYEELVNRRSKRYPLLRLHYKELHGILLPKRETYPSRERSNGYKQYNASSARQYKQYNASSARQVWVKAT